MTRHILLGIHFFVVSLFLTVLIPIQSWGACNLKTLQPGEWCDTGQSLSASGVMESCVYGQKCFGAEGASALMADWSGGVYDSKRHSLIVWGGGHSGNAMNEVYAFNLDTMTWSEIAKRTTPDANLYSAGGVDP
jgi:hypothetical protein